MGQGHQNRPHAHPRSPCRGLLCRCLGYAL